MRQGFWVQWRWGRRGSTPTLLILHIKHLKMALDRGCGNNHVMGNGAVFLSRCSCSTAYGGAPALEHLLRSPGAAETGASAEWPRSGEHQTECAGCQAGEMWLGFSTPEMGSGWRQCGSGRKGREGQRRSKGENIRSWHMEVLPQAHSFLIWFLKGCRSQ